MTDVKKYAYIELIFSEEERKYFSDIVNQIVSKDQLYYSPVMSHIKGDVTDSLHCTLFFGINPDLVENEALIKIVKEATFNEIELGKLVLFNGYQGLYEAPLAYASASSSFKRRSRYKILCVEIVDKNNEFSKFANKIEDFINDENIKYEVKPHMSLAYVMPDYEIKEYPQGLINKLKSSKIQISIQN